MAKPLVRKTRARRRRGKVVSDQDQQRLLEWIKTHHRYPLRDAVLVQLSFKAGLRAGEITGLTWPMVLAADGRVGEFLDLEGQICKKGSARTIPMNPALRKALVVLHAHCGKPLSGPVCQSERGGAMSAHSVVNWFKQLYTNVGLLGATSHSGRRTMITATARHLAATGGSLVDVQQLAGHRNLATTQGYIDGSRAAQIQLVGML